MPKRYWSQTDLEAEAEANAIARARADSNGRGRNGGGHRGKKNQKVTSLRQRGEGIIIRNTLRRLHIEISKEQSK